MFMAEAILKFVCMVAFGLVSSWAIASDMPCHKAAAGSEKYNVSHTGSSISTSDINENYSAVFNYSTNNVYDRVSVLDCCSSNCHCPDGGCTTAAAIPSNTSEPASRIPHLLFKEQLYLVLSLSLPKAIRPPIFA